MFRGHAHRAQDAKGRLMLPPDFREEVLRHSPEGKLILTNFDDCIAVYPFPEWEEIEKSFASLNMADRRMRSFHRFFIAGAMEITLDKQGRILIPPHLRQYADLKKEVVLAGVGRKFEIWDLTRFEEQRKEVELDFDSMLDSLSERGVELRI